MSLLPLLLVVALLSVATEGQRPGTGGQTCPLVATREGTVRGVVSHSASGRRFFSFLGIPYARPPLGPLRFQPPERHPGWSQTRDAARYGARCPQFDMFDNSTRQGSEDCLFVNVHTPRVPVESGEKRAGLPVMVYIHGGGFYFGAGDNVYLGPDYLMDENVVLVTFNYRLNVFGFFTTHDAAAPGNYGLLDQVMLLQWVRDNIGAFGGDPRSVTIFGQSAGGASVSLLMLSPLATGLFHRAITQSGAATALFAVNGRDNGLAALLATELNCTGATQAATVACLREVSTDQLLDVMAALQLDKDSFHPRVDIESERPLLPQDPHLLLTTGAFNQVPWLNGLTETEGALFLPVVLPNDQYAGGVMAGVPQLWTLFTGLDSIFPAKRGILDCGADLAAETDGVLEFYSANGTAGPPFGSRTLADVVSDRVFVVATSAEIQLASAHTPVYKYVFDHTGEGRLSFAELVNWTVVENVQWPVPELGTTHCDDLRYLFNVVGQPLEAPGSPAHTIIRFMVTLWTTFARTGRPSSDVLPMPEWPAFTEQNQLHMRLNSAPALGERLFEERVNFWQTVQVNEPWRHPVLKDCEQAKADAAR
ncbi:Liver carboxylesterase [Amphibalanus amphitrite]|uniref:Carboxylic ester hydrolase n=1 Tax=Amphibalanus amphitrite TaxID=1232801 RepID=A0A6A4VL31_AMPAM|nr:Liver carboxylesterase [Amphibalanus amphitrite]